MTITDSTAGAAIYYTTDGTKPSTTSNLYSGPITVSTTATLKAIAVASGYSNSAVVIASYTISSGSARSSFPNGFSATCMSFHCPAVCSARRVRLSDRGAAPRRGFAGVEFGCSHELRVASTVLLF